MSERDEYEADLMSALGCLVAASGHLLHAKDRWATLRQGISFPLSRWGDADLSDNIRIGRQWLVNAREMSARAEAGDARGEK